MKRASLCVLLCAPLLAASLAGCDSEAPGSCGSAFNASTGAVGNFGDDEPALKVEAFLRATIDLNNASLAVESDLLTACRAIATDLGIPSSELQPGAGELEVVATCSRVAQEIKDTIEESLPTGASLTILVTPGVCQVNMEVASSCAAECDVNISGEAQVECSGTLVGSCEGSCSGECVVEGSASCSGECSATCTGSCSGTCYGECSGTCSSGTQSDCKGTCSGTCTGRCDATCSGSCSGQCKVSGTATCEGECRGSCTGEFQAKCDGEAKVTANADCKAACETRANAQATCTEPEVTIVAAVGVDADAQARIDALIDTLRANYPKILRAQLRVQKTLVPVAANFVTRLTALPGAVVSLGVKAGACVAAALDVAAEAAGRVDASVSVSVEVSVSASATGSAGI